MPQKISNQQPVFSCDQCGNEFSALTDLKTHKQSHSTADQRPELENLKQAIIKEIGPERKKNKIAWGSLLVSGMMAALLLLALVQAAQSINILYKLKNNSIKPANAGVTETSLPSSLNDLPDMVGGC